MIHLYSDQTPNGLRAAIVLEESGLPFTTIRIDTGRGEQHSSSFAALNPACAIPVIVDDDGPGEQRLVLAQSGAILLYVASKCGRLVPTDPLRQAHMYHWFMQIATDVTAASSWIFNNARSMPIKAPENAAWLEARLARALADTDRWLGQHEYFADELSIADLLLFPTYAFRRKMLLEAGTYSNLCRWGAKIEQRDAVRRGMALFDGPAASA
ncbi:MAG: glutathione S-transferase N-terminal domain-containing protein [Burkholderiales bacterium]